MCDIANDVANSQSGKGEKSKGKKNRPLRFFLTILISAFIGGVAGGLIAFFNQDIHSVMETARAWFLDYALLFMILSVAVITVLTVIFYAAGKKIVRTTSLVEEEDFDKADNKFGVACSLTSLGIIVVFMLYGIVISQSKGILSGVIVFIIAIAIFTVLQGKIIGAVKELYPDKKGEFLSRSFNKEWFESCDEAERYIIYAASYKAFSVMQKAFIGVMVLLVLMGLFMDIGILPFLLVGVLWGIQQTVYQVASMKLERSQVNRP